MSLAGGRRVFLYFYLAALLIFPALQIWVCRDCKAGAARVFPGFHNSNNATLAEGTMKKELFDKFFNGRRDLNLNETEKEFEESKRRVPSCPDPLHN